MERPLDLARPAIEVNKLSKTYPGGVEAVKAIDFEVAPGEVFGLLGPNGAGKSTTIGMLTTTIRPTSGVAKLAGFDVSREPLEARRLSSVVFQDPVVDRALTGLRNLEIHARLWGVEPRPPHGASRRSPRRSGSRSLSTGPPACTAAASAGGSRLLEPSSPRRRCSFSTSRPWGSTPASGTSCST